MNSINIIYTCLIIFGILFICREIICWWFKMNQVVNLLTEIRDILHAKKNKGEGSKQPIAKLQEKETVILKDFFGKPHKVTSFKDENK
ncbi:MAG: hypothetical protein PHC29_05110 [Candidatus Omnitrophica bacterium]|nr:hypothetical protein [Candidatus Omnitrophota bacterium]